jgi:glycosyltransferase involved in cell wall biosynthesis
MKRILYLAYFFPPLGGGGCQRTLKLVRYLEPLGYGASVVTTRDKDYWILDPSLAGEVPASAEVLRVSGFTAHRALRWLGRAGMGPELTQGTRRRGVFRALRTLQSLVFIPDGFVGWAREARRAGARRIEQGGIAALWTTSSPESAHVAGLSLKRRFGLPWVADFRDPWVGRATYRPPTPLHDRAQRRLEQAVLESADCVTMVSEAMIEEYRRRYPALPEDRLALLPNGYDADDFRRAAAPLAGRPEPDRSRFLLLHAGQLAHRPTVRTVLEAVRRLRREEPATADRLRVRFLGGNEELDPRVVSRAGFAPVLEILPSAPHLESVAAMRAADALLLLGHGGRGDALIYTGKIYEYVASGRPILAVLDPGPAADLIGRLGAGVVIRPGDVAGAVSALRDWVARFVSGERPATSIPAGILATLDRREGAARAAAILDRLTA